MLPDQPLFDDAAPLVREAREVARTLRAAGCETLFAGGCVRDALLGRPVKDIDLATAAPPDLVERLFPGRTTAVGKSFGVVIVRAATASFEVATFRADGDYRDGRRPTSVRFTGAVEDAQRRDFTINGLFCDPADGTVRDYVNGRADLAAGIVRAIGDPAARFGEDHLRLLRAVRFAAVLGFRLEAGTAAAIAAHAGLLADVSAERVGQEFTRMLCEAPRASRALDLLLDLGLLAVFLPEVVALKGQAQPPAFHPEGDVWTHTSLMLDDIAAPRDPVLAYAALLHDVGKPPACRPAAPDADPAREPRFPRHAAIGGRIARDILLRLRRPRAQADTVAAIVARHMTFADVAKMRLSRLRRFMGAPCFGIELELHRLDVRHSHGKDDTVRFIEQKLAAFATEPVLPPAWVGGRDLLDMGLTPGPDIGRWLKRAYDAQLAGRIPDREALLAWLRATIAARGSRPPAG